MFKLLGPKSISGEIHYPYFQELSLPEVTILTGHNGTGKSQFLAAVLANVITFEAAGEYEIVSLGRDDNRNSFDGSKRWRSRAQIKQSYESSCVNQARIIAQQTLSHLANNDLSDWLRDNSIDPWAEVEDSTQRLAFGNYRKQIKNWLRDSGQSPGDGGMITPPRLLQRVAQVAGKPLHLLEDSDFILAEQIQSAEYLENSLKSAYEDYINERNQFVLDRLGGLVEQIEIHGAKLSEFSKEFEREQIPPWRLIDEAIDQFLSSADNEMPIRFSITHPTGPFVGLSKPNSFKFEPQVEIDGRKPQSLTSLSSGEAAILGLTIRIVRHLSLGKKRCLFLLDELDASLHPSLQRFYLSAINTFAELTGSKFIVATHSPTTVALSKSESVLCFSFENGKRKQQLLSKSDAIDLLTESFVSLGSALKIFDEIGDDYVAIMSEGRNAEIIKRYLQVSGFKKSKVVLGVQRMSGVPQLSTMYRFFCETVSKRQIVFVVDCDAAGEVAEWPAASNFVAAIAMPHFAAHPIKKGIENAFSEGTIRRALNWPPDQKIAEALSGRQKRQLSVQLSTFGELEDFVGFAELGELLRQAEQRLLSTET